MEAESLTSSPSELNKPTTVLPSTTALRCSKCKEYKDPGDFNPRSDRPRGRHSRCRACLSQYRVDPSLPPGHLPCSRCRKVKPEDHFRFRRSRGSGKRTKPGRGRDSLCVSCRLDHDKEYRDSNGVEVNSRRTGAWAEQNPERMKELRQRSGSKKREAMRALILSFKATPCMDCEVAYPYYIMHCDHRPGEVKMFDVSRVPTIELLQLELAKCDPVCGNCHAERTHQRKQKKLQHTDKTAV